MTPFCNSQPFDDDNKYAKFSSAQKTPGPLQKYHEALGVLPVLFRNSSFVFACVYVLLGLFYVLQGGHPGHTPVEKLLNLGSISIEVLGLLILRHKIQHRSSVNGISGMTMLMYAAVYTVRIGLNMPDSWNFSFMELELEASFGIISLLLVLDCLRSIFVTHRSTYQDDLDVLHVKYLLPGCFVLAIMLRVQFHAWTTLHSYMWSSCLYMDVLALMPQVVMMARGGGKVEAPIAHFVAATFLSRVEDLSDSLLFQGSALHSDEYFSYYTVIFIQGLHLLLVADFMYYYVKARTSGAGVADDVNMIEV